MYRREFLERILSISLASPLVNATSATPQELPTFSPNTPYSRAFNFASLRSWITPNAQFFVRSHFPVPSYSPNHSSGSDWRSRTQPLLLSSIRYSQLESREEVVTLECAGNGVGLGMVSNARWTGTSLANIVRSARARPKARCIRG